MDNDFLSRAWVIGGRSYLDQLAMLTKRDGYMLAVTDVVESEISAGPHGEGIQNWLKSKTIPAVQTQELLPYTEFESAKAAGILLRMPSIVLQV